MGLYRRQLLGRVPGDPAILSPQSGPHFARPQPSGSLELLDRERHRLSRSCGCREGMVGLLLGVTAFVVQGRIHPVPSASLIHQIMTVAGFALVGAVLGKIVGLTWARLRSRALRARIAKIEKRALTRSHHKI